MDLHIQRRKREEDICSFELRCSLQSSPAERTGLLFYQAIENLEPDQAEIISQLLDGSVTKISSNLREIETLEQQVSAACAALRDYLCRASVYASGTQSEKTVSIVTLKGREFLPGSGRP